MKLSWAGKLFAAAVGAKVAAAGLRYAADHLPNTGALDVDCPNCGETVSVPHAGRFCCHHCNYAFDVLAPTS